MTDIEDQNKLAKQVQEQFAKAMSTEVVKGQVINMGDFLERRFAKQNDKAKEFLEQAKKVNAEHLSELKNDPFAAPVLRLARQEADKAQKTREHLVFIRNKEAEAAMAEARKEPTQAPPMAQVINIRPNSMNWGLPILNNNPPKE